MCGRYVITPSAINRIRLALDASFEELAPRYNIAPSELVPIIRRKDDGGYEQAEVRWGLIPFWAPEPNIKYSTFNARAETVRKAPAFREPFKHRRCLVPASGFYEWQEFGKGQPKQPWYISNQEDQGWAFAGLWDRWHDKLTGGFIDSCTIIVGPANDLVATIHAKQRQPCIIPPEHYKDWLNPEAPAEFLMSLLSPVPSNEMRAWPVSTEASNARHQGPRLIKPLSDA